MKKILIAAGAAALILFGNEVISWAALCVLAGLGLVSFLKAAAKGGAFDV